MYRSTQNYENQQKMLFDGVGEYGIPQIELHHTTHANSYHSTMRKAVRIEQIMESYVSMLQDFKCVMSPDFSTYTDFPKALQVYNHFRKHWIGAYMQMNGIDVIPTISWSDKESFSWCFDGEPVGGVVAVAP